MKKFLILLSFAISCLSCSPSKVERQLSDIETYINDRPDSALAVLESMDRNLMKTEEERAHHALLHAMALDKNYIDVADDSLARIAVEYYSEHGPEKYEARSLYYLGLAYFYQGDYNKAIVEFTKGEEVAERSDSLYLGFIKAAQATVYNKSYNAVEALDCLREAYEIDVKMGNEYYAQTSMLSLSRTLYNIKRVKESSSILLELINDVKTDKRIKLAAKALFAFISTVESVESEGVFEKAIELYNEVLDNSGAAYMSKRHYWALAYSLNATGRKDEAQDIIGQLSVDESGTSSYWQYMIAKFDGDLEPALSHLEDYIKYNDIEVSDALKQSLALSQRDYYETQAELSEYEAENSRLWLSVVILSSSVGLILIVTGLFWYVSRQKRIKEQYISCISEIYRQLEEAKKDDYPALKRKYLSLYKSRFSTIGELCEQYIHSRYLVNAENSVFNKVVSMVDDFTEDYTNREKFEAMLDADLDNIMSNLRLEMPSLKEKDYVIFSFLLIGFDVTTISNLMNITTNTVYIRKSRIKSQIQEHDPRHKEQFLEALD